MAQLVNVLLNKGEAPSLGFRIQGGKDFGTPLIIQKVNYGSPAEKAGLQAGDSVIKINNVDVFSMRHKDAQDVIIRAGPAFEITVQRGGSTWKPSVIPTTPSVPKPQPASNNYSPVTKTSLAANPQSSIGAIGTGHNVSAKPFNSQVNGTVNGGPKFVNKQYNTPLGLYSEQSIAETLSAQAEVLSTGVLGVNFKKNEKNYDASNSEVFRMVQEADKEPKQQESEPDSGVVTAPLSSVVGLRHVTAPETKPTPPTPQLPPGQNICAECERLVTGVFVRIKDKNLHVECFKCATCGTSLKNVGYYNINNKLYCDVHAKLAARSNPPSQNEVPVTIKPGGTIPPALASSLAKNRLPSSTAPLSPNQNQTALPFSQSVGDVSSTLNNNETIANVNTSETFQSDITTVDSGHQKKDDQRKRPSLFGTKYDPIKNEGPISFSAYMSKSGTNFSSPRPFSSVSAPLSPPTNVGYSTLPKASPVSVPFSSPAPSVPSSVKEITEHVKTNPEVTNGNQNGSISGPQSPVSSKAPKLSTLNIRQHIIASSKVPTPPIVDIINEAENDEINLVQNNAMKQNDSNHNLKENHANGASFVLQNLLKSKVENTNDDFKNESNKNETTEQCFEKEYNNGNINFSRIISQDGNNGIDKSNKSTNQVEKSLNNSAITRSVENNQNLEPICCVCNTEIERGPFITALGKIWCPDHFVCTSQNCKRPLADIGFIEEQGQLYCEYCFEQYLAPNCSKCGTKVKGDCLKAIGKNFHPECFNCSYCGKLFGNSPFFLEDGQPYCENDWNEMFTTKCFACGFPVEAGDRWVEALNNNYHSQCFNCTMCKKNLEGQSFFAKGGRPFCKNHAR